MQKHKYPCMFKWISFKKVIMSKGGNAGNLCIVNSLGLSKMLLILYNI